MLRLLIGLSFVGALKESFPSEFEDKELISYYLSLPVDAEAISRLGTFLA